jgi:hypothetical protein
MDGWNGRYRTEALIIRRGWLPQWVAGASSLIYVLDYFVPWKPPEYYGSIEDSWMLALHAAFQERLQFGSDLVFPFGPWGFLYGGYYPATHYVAALTWSVLAVVFWWVAWRTARFLFANEWVAWLWLMAVIATTDTTLFLNIDVRLSAWVLLLLLRHFFVEDRPFAASEATLVVALGLLSLIKFSVTLHVALVVSVVALDVILRQRRFPWQVPLYGVSLLVFWSLAGQRLSSIGPYVTNSLRIVGGYTEAMMLSGPKEFQNTCLFLAAAAVLLTLAGYAAWLRHRFVGTLFLVGWSYGLFSTFKNGYVRHDVHEVAAVLELFLMSLFCLALLWPQARRRGWAFLLSILLLPLSVGAFAASTYARHAEPGWLASRLRLPSRDGDRRTLRDAYQGYLAHVRKEVPLPRLAGTTDAYPCNGAELFAHGLPLRSRPVIHSYCAFSPQLANLNAAFLRGDSAPENILFQVWALDDRYPSLDDGLSWPELFTRYDLQDVEFTFVLLRRSPSPRRFRLSLLRQVPLAFGEQLNVPATTDGPVWAEIVLDHTVAGSVVSALYKPPELRFNVTVRDGRQLAKRLVPGMTKGGFLLSPFVEDNTSFASLAAADWRGDLADNEVTALSVTAAAGSSATTYYRNPMSVRLYRLEYPGQDIWSVNGFRQATHLKSALRDSATLFADRPPKVIYSPGAGSILDVPRESAIRLLRPQGAQRVKLKFGIRGGDGNSPPATSGIVFQLFYVNAQRQPVVLWSQRIEPASRADDQQTHESDVDLQGVPSSELILETLPVEAGTSDPTTPYWSDIDFEGN